MAVEDPFEAFKKKKEAKKQAEAQAAQNAEAAAKALGWIEGCGPGEVSKDPTKPKGFVKGRFAKKKIDPQELAKLKPKKLDPTMLKKQDPKKAAIPVEQRKDVPPEEQRLPKKFTKF